MRTDLLGPGVTMRCFPTSFVPSRYPAANKGVGKKHWAKKITNKMSQQECWRGRMRGA